MFLAFVILNILIQFANLVASQNCPEYLQEHSDQVNNINSIVYYLDISKAQNNTINAIKPDYTVSQMEFVEELNKILISNQFQLLLAEPYTLQASKVIYLEEFNLLNRIKNTNYAVIVQKKCQNFIIDIFTLSVVSSFNGCYHGVDNKLIPSFLKTFTLLNGQVFISILEKSGFQTWLLNLNTQIAAFQGYLQFNGTVYNGQYADIDKHDNYDILFVAASPYYINVIQIIKGNTLQYQTLQSINYLSTGFTQVYQVVYNQTNYFVTAQSTTFKVAKDTIGGPRIIDFSLPSYVKTYVNSFIQVKNCNYCFVTLIDDQIIHYQEIFQSTRYSWIGLWYYFGLNLQQISSYVEAYHEDQTDSVWVIFGLPLKIQKQQYLFQFFDIKYWIFKSLSSGNPTDDANKTCYALYSHPNKKIVGLDVFAEYKCLFSIYGQLYNNGETIYLLAVCGDFQIISFNIVTGKTQKVYQLKSVPNHINSFEEIQLIGFGDNESGHVYLYKFNKITGLFEFFIYFTSNKFNEESLNLTYMPETQSIWIQYRQHNTYFPIGYCLQNLESCLSCQMDFYFSTTEKQQSDNLYGLGTIDSPFTSSKSLIELFHKVQKYYFFISGIKQITVNIYLDPSYQMSFQEELFDISFSNSVKLNILSLNSKIQAPIKATGLLNFSSFKSLAIQNLLFNFSISNSSERQCGLSFQQVSTSVVISNINNYSLNDTVSCYQIYAVNSTVVFQNILIKNQNLSNLSQIALVQDTSTIIFNSFNITECTLSDKFRILKQVNDVQVIINSLVISENKCSSSQYQQTKIVGSENQLDYKFSFSNIQIGNNQFYTAASYLFFSAIYYFNLLPQHTFVLENFESFNNTYYPIQNTQNSNQESYNIIYFIQINKLNNINLSNITFKNHFEIGIFSLSQSENVQVYNITCSNDNNFQRNNISPQYAGCVYFSDISNLNLNLFKASNINSQDNSIISIINQDINKYSLINFTSVEVYSSAFIQSLTNTYSNPIFILSPSNSQINIQKSSFQYNNLMGLVNSETQSTTAIQIINPLGSVFLNDTFFQNSNSNSKYNYLYVQSDVAEIQNCTFLKSSYDISNQNAIFKQQGGCARIKSNNLRIINSQFLQSTSYTGTFLYIDPLSQTLSMLVNCSSFSQGYSQSDGSAFFINSLNTNFDIQILSSNFSDIYSYSEDSNTIFIQSDEISQISQGNLFISQVVIQNILGMNNNSFVNIINSNANIQNLNASQTQISKFTSQFDNTKTLKDFSFVSIVNTQNSNASFGGAISIFGMTQNNNTLSQSYFQNNNASKSGGAIYLNLYQNDECQFQINSTVVINNKALTGYGGAFYISSLGKNSSLQKILIAQSSVISNQAMIGGGVYNQGINPQLDSLTSISNNQASYNGNNQYSYPSELYLTNQNSLNHSFNQEKQIIVLNDFKSGGILPCFEFQLRDQSQKPYILFNSEIIEAYFQIIGIPNTTSYFEFKSDSIKIFNNQTNEYDLDYSYLIQVNFRNCQNGETINKYSNLQECQTCETGKYTLDFLGCYACPEGGNCTDGKISLLPGYWREKEYSEDIIQCINRPENCVGDSFGNLACQQGYIGPLCEECDIFGQSWIESYTRQGKYECALCKNSKLSMTKLVLMLTNYFQIISAASTFNLGSQIGFMQVLSFFGQPIQTQIDYLDCVLKNYNRQIPLIYFKLVFSVFSFVAILVLYTIKESQVLNLQKCQKQVSKHSSPLIDQNNFNTNMVQTSSPNQAPLSSKQDTFSLIESVFSIQSINSLKQTSTINQDPKKFKIKLQQENKNE
ncbi:hypothetical protein ABPG74_002673 [Tetrahymena malaccensis]